MDIVRKAMVLVAGAVLGFLLLGLAAVWSLNSAFGAPDTLKQTLQDSGAYRTFVDSTLDQNQDASSLPLDNPEVRAAAHQAFSPELLQTSAATAIDNVYAWLAGETAQPTFRVDFDPAKRQFAAGIGDYARQRLASLPVCTSPPSSLDPLTIDCRPPGINVEPEIQRLTDQLATTDEYLADPVITAQNLTVSSEQDSGEVPFFARYSEAPAVFQLLRLAPFVLLGLIGLATVAVIFGSRPHRAGLKRIGLTLLSSGGFLLLGMLLLQFLLARLDFNALSGLSSVQDGLAASFATSLRQVAGRTLLIFSAVYLGVGLALMLAVRLGRQKT